ncbi:hypothetical protein [Intestinibacter sp.]|uniref:hypothetical protein n=1 Tax=Intestinibacter sp. TaxID=1965304 RepID=UPI002A908DD4|nr:hypothetical protein [Intestinibacter sp.]MDY5211220.1 hypothetical protein [Intestinibacter sp.]
MNKKQIERENLKYVLYSIFDNYGDLSKKIYIVVNKSENNNQICEEILKKINQNTPSFIRKILSGYNDYSDNATVKLKKINQNLEIVSKYELDNKEDIVIDIFSSDLYKEKNKYSYESKFVVDYILSLDEIKKTRLFRTLNNKKIDHEEVVNEEQNYLNINDLYNICISQTLWKSGDDISKINNWIYNIINPNVLHSELFDKMIETINIQLNNMNFSAYLEYILSKDENKSLDYISPSGDLYQLLLFEDMLRIDYKDKCSVKIDLDVDYIGKWWSENILPLFKAKYSEDDLLNQLQLEIKKNEIIDFHGKNFEKFKKKIIDEIQKEYSEIEILEEDFEKDEKISLEKNIKELKPQNISDLEHAIEESNLKYEGNKELLKEYCSDKFIDILENKEKDYNLKELEKCLKENEEYFNDKAYVYFEICIQKKIQTLEENLLNDICDVKNLNELEQLHNKILENGDFVKCEDLESIIFTKMESIIKTLNLAEINDDENIRIANNIYDNTESIDLEKYPVAELLICRDINIDLENVMDSINYLKDTINDIKETVRNNCIFNYEYYNMNIQINEAENYYTIKFRYLNDLVDYIRLKEGNSFLLNLKSINKDVKHKKRVFNKGNAEIIKEIDNFYSDKQMAKSK